MKSREKTVSTELIKFATLLAIIGRTSRQAVYDLMRRDESFPRPIRVPGGQIVWRQSEVMAWIDSLPRAEFDGVDAVSKRQLSRVAA